MKDWLSGNWEPNWRSYGHFNLYRLIVALFFLFSQWLPLGWNTGLGVDGYSFLKWLAFVYAVSAAVGVVLSLRWRHRFNLQLTTHVCLDVLAFGSVMYMFGGVSSGLGLLLMILLAAASLVGQGRLVLFYASIATLMILSVQSYGIWRNKFEITSIVQAGLLSGGFFATAILARLLGRRAMENQELARRRGVALENQNRVSHRILERMQDGVLVIDREACVIGFNPGAAEMLGRPIADGTGLRALSGRLAKALADWLRGEGNNSVTFEGDTGNRLNARFEATESSAGEVLVFIEDMGRIRAQAQQMKLASLGRLTASIAHEIRNPLAAISHASDLLHEERRGEMHDRLLRIVRDNIFRLDRIVQDVLQLGRRDHGQPESIHLPDFLPGFVDEFCVVEHVAPEVVCLACQPENLWFDRSHLLQVLWNLVGNALRHASRRPGSVCLRVVGAIEGRVELHVIDDGPGVPEEQREQIFEPFFTTCHQGTGLGLFIARELCETNGAVLQLLPDAGGHFVIVGGRECREVAVNVV